MSAGINKMLILDEKCKHAAISGSTKQEICQKLSAYNPPKQKDLVLLYNISEQAVSDICKSGKNILLIIDDAPSSNIEYEQIYELNELITKLPINNPLNANEYLYLDDILLIKEIPDDMILIEQFHHKHENTQSDDDDNDACLTEPSHKISLQEGSHIAKELVEFLLQQHSEFGISSEELGVVRC
ncbi:17406_t:CDS:2, partial [Cetraspora pellucida]